MSLDSPRPSTIDGSQFRFAIITARYNTDLVNALLDNALSTLSASGSTAPQVLKVPGSAELPFAASQLAKSGQYDAIIVIGVVIAGDTNHHNIIGDSTATALQTVSIKNEVPVINGILVTNTLAQAEIRATGEINRGKEFAQAALEMAEFTKQWKTTNQ